MELTDAIREYVEKRSLGLEKFMQNNDTTQMVRVEVGKTTMHHKHGDVYKAQFDITIAGAKFHAVSEKEDLYSAIDDAKEGIIREITSNKDRRGTLFRRGARSVKKMLKGISKRNPFTSKY